MDINAAGSSEAGATADQIRSISKYESSALFSAEEQTVLRFADRLTATPADVPDELYAAVVGMFGEAGAVELASAIAWENYRARFNRAFDVENERFCSLDLHRSGDASTESPRSPSDR
jgi:alkylhydroperoxidase family enzyme